MKNWIGVFITAIGIVHIVFGLVVFQPVLSEIWAEGVLNTVHMQPMREACFWFLFSGVLFIILGLLVRWIEKQSSTLPIFLGWTLLAVSAIGVFIMPASGFWLMFAPAVGAIFKSKANTKI